MTRNGSGNGTALTSISNVTLRNITISNFCYDISLQPSSGNTLSGEKVERARAWFVAALSSVRVRLILTSKTVKLYMVTPVTFPITRDKE